MAVFSGVSTGVLSNGPNLDASSTPTPPPVGGLSASSGLYAKVNKKISPPSYVNSRKNHAPISTKRESPDEGIQDDVSTDV